MIIKHTIDTFNDCNQLKVVNGTAWPQPRTDTK